MKRIFIIGGGTGGHIFPGLALARAFIEKGEEVFWLGNSFGMENRIVTEKNIPFLSVDFKNFRKKGWLYRLQLPFFLLRSFFRCFSFFRQVRPHIIIGTGGYVCFPGYLASFFLKIPLVIHEQNARAGLTNRFFSPWARLRFCGFPHVLKNSQYVGNPVRPEFLHLASPKERFQKRQGPLRLLVLGGSQGTRVFNEVLPRAILKMPNDVMPIVYHQSGFSSKEAVCQAYGHLKTVKVFDFREDIISLYEQADFIICRAGAMTVTEIGVIGLAALFIPYPYAADDHQMVNAQFFVAQGAGYVLHQKDFNEEWLSRFLLSLDRAQCLSMSLNAYKAFKTCATEEVVQSCYQNVLNQSST